MKPERDAFGQMLLAHHNGGERAEIIERDDGFIETGPGGKMYFAPFADWSPFEQEAMDYVQGRVLDIGCGAGRQALYLQTQGHAVVATDDSPLAVQVCQARGVQDAHVIPITQLSRDLGQFDTLLMMGNNFGLFANRGRARWLLRRFWGLTTSEGRIIASSHNIYGTDNAAHLAYHQRNRERGRMAGQIRFRVRFRQYKGGWMDYLMVSPDEMREIAAGTGWKISTFLGDENGLYMAVIEKA